MSALRGRRRTRSSAPGLFAGPPRSFTIRSGEGDRATTFAASAFDALGQAKDLWPSAREWAVEELPAN